MAYKRKIDQKAASKAHYAKNKKAYIDRSARASKQEREKIHEFILDYLKDHPCVDCEESNPIVLEFDHFRDKIFCIGSSSRRIRLKDVQKEVVKCEVRCANCHRIKTYRERGFTHRGES